MGAPQQREPEPTESTAGSGPDSGGTADAAAVAPPPAKGRRLTRRVIITIVVAVAAVLGVGAVAALVAYEKATGPNRSTPTVAVDQFLQAVFVDKSKDRVALFTCETFPADTAMATVSSGIDPTVHVSWEGLSIDQTTSPQTVRAQLKLSSGGFTQVQDWQFDLVDRAGWRVCGARLLS